MRALLLGVRAVEPRERLHRVDAAELLVHVHRVQQRLVEAGLELVGDDQEAVLRPLERLGGLRLREAVHAGLGVGLAAVLDRAGEGDQRLERIARAPRGTCRPPACSARRAGASG